jgi:hypothetical protein
VPDRLESLLRKVCLLLLLALAVRVGYAVLRPNPLANLQVPAVPRLAGEPTNAPAAGPDNAGPPGSPPVAAQPPISTNRPSGTNASLTTLSNAPAGLAQGTNSETKTPGTNQTAKAANPAPKPVPGPLPGGPPRGGPRGMSGPGGPPKPPATLSTLAQARLDKVLQSEILAPIPRPLPLALLGIAGSHAFLRTTNGQSGMVAVGADLGGVKLLLIGINRVLVEDGGSPKELTIFEGAGGESLLPK